MLHKLEQAGSMEDVLALQGHTGFLSQRASVADRAQITLNRGLVASLAVAREAGHISAGFGGIVGTLKPRKFLK